MTSEPGLVTRPEAQAQARTGAYLLEGEMFEACDCKVLCPCCAGEQPDNGSCNSVLAYRIESGHVNQVGVDGLIVVAVLQSPGRMADGNWRRALITDQRAREDQMLALTEAFEGRLGGPLADFAGLVRERVDSSGGAIDVGTTGAQAMLSIGTQLQVDITQLLSPTGEPLILSHTMLAASPPPGTRLAKTGRLNVDMPAQRMTWTLSGTHASRSTFRFEA